MTPPYRYVSPDEDSGRWLDFPFREGDIVISTRSKSGTTWMQMICALLVFGTPELPEPLGRLSPWLDHLVASRAAVLERLEQQHWRRIIKTHTPLDGIPIDARAHYIVVARHPLDMAVSLYHQGDNIDRTRLAELTGAREPSARPRRSAHDWLVAWIAADADPRQEMDSLAGVLWHLSDAWRRRDESNVTLVHYDDLSADLGGQMRRLADRLGIVVEQSTWPGLVRAATFEQMRANASSLIPDSSGILKDEKAFFRRGHSGAGRELLSEDELRAYQQRVSTLAAPDLLSWLHW
jgi:aryl sulfotransferase